MKKLTKTGKTIFYTIESILVAMIMIGSFKIYALSLIGLPLLALNTKFISNHTEA